MALNVIEYKIVLVGDSSSDKTSFFKKIIIGDFYEKNISTIGMDSRTISLDIDFEDNQKIEKKSFEIKLFDTSGQERSGSITKNYYKDSDGILLLYDVTNRDSFDNIHSWLGSIINILGENDQTKYCIFLIGNKIDLIGRDGNDRYVEEEEAIKLCEENNIIWGGEISVKIFTEVQLKEKLKDYVKQIYLKIGSKKASNPVLKMSKMKKKNKCIII